MDMVVKQHNTVIADAHIYIYVKSRYHMLWKAFGRDQVWRNRKQFSWTSFELSEQKYSEKLAIEQASW